MSCSCGQKNGFYTELSMFISRDLDRSHAGSKPRVRNVVLFPPVLSARSFCRARVPRSWIGTGERTRRCGGRAPHVDRTRRLGRTLRRGNAGRRGGVGWAQHKKYKVIRYFIHLLPADRRRSWQANIHCSAFFEIYKICIILHRSNLRNLANVRQTL